MCIRDSYKVNDRMVLMAIELMENHIADPLELDQMARIVGVSTRQLNRLFAEKLNVSTVRFYRALRLEKARELLQQTTLNIAEISSATGFANSAHFSRRFSVQYERPPSTFRRAVSG